ncbi:ATPase [Serinibacter arcticus]|uniref:ATPase n=1 Tax=Serinibacter arcticus TaxID=1655435 RepID=A0A2U1ZS65_9MICO|nr:HAD-IC family P-type ATPase [Serinibacter arcticus]PWD49827.1 ATPase [Serinibacter arcticus]
MSTADAPTAVGGLTSAEVADRVARGETNVADDSSSRSLGQILRANTFTLFNAMLATAFVLVMLTGQWQDGLFGFVLILNTAIGVVTEYRSKRTLDNLAILDAPTAQVWRDGAVVTLAVGEIVKDDVISVSTGDQVPVDGEVLEVRGLEANESLLTGESRPVRKAVGDEVLSGSSIVAGSARVVATRVGENAYAQKITAAARRYSLASSELQGAVKRILRVITIIIVPMALLLGLSQVRALGGWDTVRDDGTWRDAVVQAVAGVVGMIPDGLVLLISMNFALAAVVLARRNVLVQELPAVEVLARVDVICLDKTGTITDGAIACDEMLAIDAQGHAHAVDLSPDVLAALSAIGADPEANATAAAIGVALPGGDDAAVRGTVPFSSARKWSALLLDRAWVLGAPEVVLAGREDALATGTLAAAHARATGGSRVVVLCRAGEALPDPDAPLPVVEPVALVVLGEHVREDAAETLAFFRDQEVGLRVISGDDPTTVAAIAGKVDLLGSGGDVPGADARQLPQDVDELATALESASVLGRVTPEQKVGIVEALQSRGHTVAMTGDGVNDALAIKTADLGIAMGNGARATKAVSRLVLLDGKFSTLPGVLAQGRRVIANMERVANFFLVKTAYSTVLALVTVLAGFVVPIAYPFLPRQLTLVSALTIGIPGFLLSLPSSSERYVPGFLRRVLTFAIPAGVVVAVAALVVTAVASDPDVAGTQMARTLATLSTLGLGMVVVVLHARPLVWWKVVMVAVLTLAGLAAPYVPLAADFFLLERPDAKHWLIVAVVVVVGGALLVGVRALARRAGTSGRGKIS